MPAQIFYSLSERHAHREFRPSDIKHGGLPAIIGEAAVLVVNHATHLPRLHRYQANPGDTALLLVRPALDPGMPRGYLLIHRGCRLARTGHGTLLPARMLAWMTWLTLIRLLNSTANRLCVAGTQLGFAGLQGQ